MSFEAWAPDKRDPGRKRRFAVAYGSATIVLAGLLATAVAFGSVAKHAEQDEEVDVKFVEKLPEAPPPPPPPPPPEAKPLAMRKAAPIVTPTAVPTEKPPEIDPSQAKAALPIGDGDPNGDPNGSARGKLGGTGTAEAPPPPPPPVVVAKPTGPIQLPEDATPPVAISKVMPGYPQEARSQGIEALVIVKFVVTESGDVTDVRIVRGHPLFDDTVLASVKTWKFTPAMSGGQPLSVFRIVKIPFKLKT